MLDKIHIIIIVVIILAFIVLIWTAPGEKMDVKKLIKENNFDEAVKHMDELSIYEQWQNLNIEKN